MVAILNAIFAGMVKYKCRDQPAAGRTHSGIIPAMLEAVRVDAVVGRLNGPSPLTKLIFST